MSTPLFVGSYLQLCGGLLANEKEEIFALNDNMIYALFLDAIRRETAVKEIKSAL